LGEHWEARSEAPSAILPAALPYSAIVLFNQEPASI